MEPNTLSATDICAILDSCSKNNVKTLKFLTLEVAFENSLEPASTKEVFVNQIPLEAASESKVEESDFVPFEAGEGESLLEELRLAQLMTDDPVAYEQAVIDANLERGAGDETEDYRGFEPDL